MSTTNVSLSDTIPSFKPGLEEQNINLAKKPPQAILDLPTENPGREKLSEEESKIAKKELTNWEYIKLKFPRTVKLHTDPPYSGQTFGVISFVPSRGATPDAEGCYGVMKLRGVFDSIPQADNYTEFLIREHDSYSSYDMVWVGKPFPLFKDNAVYALATKEIDIRSKVSTVLKEELKERREIEKKQAEEVQERHRQLLSDVGEEREKHYDDLEFYVQLRTKKANLLFREDDLKKRLEESQKLVEQIRTEITAMDKKFPEYKTQYLDRYKKSLASSGIDTGKNPLIQYMEKD